MTIDFYYMPGAAPCRAIQMTAKAVGVELNHIHLDIEAGEQFAPEFLKINVQHTIPTFVDNGLVLTESRAILPYLVQKYGKHDHPLFPNDVQQQAVINQRLYFDMGTFYASFANYYYPRFFGGATEFDPEAYIKIEDALSLLNQFLEGQTFAAGNTFTIADIALVASASSFLHADGVQIGNKYPNVSRWYNKCKTVAPRYDINVAGLQTFKKYFSMLKE